MSRQLSALSGLAIVLVVLNHSVHMAMTFPPEQGYAAAEGWVRYLLLMLQQLGLFAVPTFLFISGCFIVYAAQGNPPRLAYKTMWARLKHILLPYLVWCFTFYVLLYIQYGELFSLPEYLKDILVGYPFHFVPLLVFYYLISPILVKLGKRYGWLVIGAIALYQFMLINIVFPGTFGITPPVWMSILVPRVLGTTMAEWGIFFPLGMVYGLHAKAILPWLRKVRWGAIMATLLFFVLNVLHQASLVSAPYAGYIYPLTFIALIPLIRRDAIPKVQWLEEIGRKSYGIYLTHLIVVDVTLVLFQAIIPGLLSVPFLLQILLFIIGLGVPLVMMNGFTRSPARVVYRYVFG